MLNFYHEIVSLRPKEWPKRCEYDEAQEGLYNRTCRVAHCFSSSWFRLLFNDFWSDFFKNVDEEESVEHLNVTLNKAAEKQIDNYTSQQVSNKSNNAWRDASASEIKGAMDSSKFIDDDKQKYQF